jgi:hypothetical protein
MKFHIDIGCRHMDTESFYRLGKYLIVAAPNSLVFKHNILPMFLLLIVVHCNVKFHHREYNSVRDNIKKRASYFGCGLTDHRHLTGEGWGVRNRVKVGRVGLRPVSDKCL